MTVITVNSILWTRGATSPESARNLENGHRAWPARPGTALDRRPRAFARRAVGYVAAVLIALLCFLLQPAWGAPARGVPTPVEDPGHRGLAAWFTALKSASEGKGVARALHYGDSTIAADGFARTLRGRLVARFGDAGPGFVTAAFNPTWHQRSDVTASRGGGWGWRTILLGGGGGRYGLGGIVGIVESGAYAVIRAVDAEKNPIPQAHAELWYQSGKGYGSYSVKVDDREIGRGSAASSVTEDRRFALAVPEGFTKLVVGASGGTVPMYGVVLETGKPGATWEAMGVVGVGSKSFSTFAGAALRPQMEQRKPNLVVVMLGGNEAGYPALMSKEGVQYEPVFSAGLDTILAGKGSASCLVVTPLDQGFVDEVDQTPKGRPGMKNLVAVQRRVAAARGCAFWSTYDAMGGAGSALAWANTRGLGTGDYVHVTPKGLELLGGLLADALLADYEAWLSRG